jgi:hypothetical protein
MTLKVSRSAAAFEAAPRTIKMMNTNRFMRSPGLLADGESAEDQMRRMDNAARRRDVGGDSTASTSQDRVNVGVLTKTVTAVATTCGCETMLLAAVESLSRAVVAQFV